MAQEPRFHREAQEKAREDGRVHGAPQAEPPQGIRANSNNQPLDPRQKEEGRRDAAHRGESIPEQGMDRAFERLPREEVHNKCDSTCPIHTKVKGQRDRPS